MCEGLSTPKGSKRARSADSDNPDSSSSTPQPHAELCFHDGNIVLLAENTYFRVHKSVLSRHSSVFDDMLSVPQPSPAAGTNDGLIEGCSVVSLSDKTIDLAVILSVLYNTCPKYITFNNPLPIRSVVAMVELGHKYQIEEIQKEGVRRLEQCFPSKLKDFHSGVSFAATHPFIPQVHGIQRRSVDMTKEYAVSIIYLARKFDLKSILPAAFFTMAQAPITTLVRVTCKPSTIDNHPARLSQEDLVRCLEGKDKLIKAFMEAMNDMKPSEKCVDKYNCSTSFNNIRTAQCRGGMFNVTHVLRDFAGVYPAGNHEPYTLCTHCRADAEQKVEEEREKRWNSLAEVFRL